MDIHIKSLQESPFNYDDVVALLHSSFEERLEQGLRFTCSFMTVKDLQERTRNGIVLVAWSPDEKVLLGTVSMSYKIDKHGIKFGYHENLAVSPMAKRMGVGKLLFAKFVSIVSSNYCQYIISDTAVDAKSSVLWHINNGFKIIALRSFPSTNYYSYIFRKQLSPSKMWNNKLFIWLRYNISSILIKSIYKKDGKYTFFGQMLRQFIRR